MQVIDCGRCDGKGCIRGFAHVENGVCFSCMGAKVLIRASTSKGEVKYYFPAGYFQVLDEFAEKRPDRAVAVAVLKAQARSVLAEHLKPAAVATTPAPVVATRKPSPPGCQDNTGVPGLIIRARMLERQAREADRLGQTYRAKSLARQARQARATQKGRDARPYIPVAA